MKTRIISVVPLLLVWMLAIGLAPAGCGNDDDDGGGGDGDTDADTDADSDSDTDGDTDADACQSCDGPVCVASVSGRVLFEDDTPYAEQALQFCVGNCYITMTDANGLFSWGLPAGCMAFDFETEKGIDLTLFDVAEQAEDWARYAVSYKPTQEEISADFDLDVGTLYYFAVPEAQAAYTATGGAAVENLSGVSFAVAPGDLGAADLAIRVLEFPLDQWVPPFVPEGLSLDALFFIGPYFTGSTAGIELRIDPSSAGWAGSDSGTAYMLGDFAMGEFLSCDGATDFPVGVFDECVAASFQGGRIVTEPLPRLGWVGIARD